MSIDVSEIGVQYSIYCQQDIMNGVQVMVRPMEANLTHDTETFGLMSPYVKIYLGGQYHRSTTAEHAGKDPHWNDNMMFTLPFNCDPILKVEVWDNDTVNDDLIGSGMHNIAQYLSQGMNTTLLVDLYYQNRPAGRINISLQFNNQMGMGMGMGGGMMGPGMGGGMMGPGMGGGYGGGNPMNQGGMGGGWGSGW